MRGSSPSHLCRSVIASDAVTSSGTDGTSRSLTPSRADSLPKTSPQFCPPFRYFEVKAPSDWLCGKDPPEIEPISPFGGGWLLGVRNRTYPARSTRMIDETGIRWIGDLLERQPLCWHDGDI